MKELLSRIRFWLPAVPIATFVAYYLIAIGLFGVLPAKVSVGNETLVVDQKATLTVRGLARALLGSDGMYAQLGYYMLKKYPPEQRKLLFPAACFWANALCERGDAGEVDNLLVVVRNSKWYLVECNGTCTYIALFNPDGCVDCAEMAALYGVVG